MKDATPEQIVAFLTGNEAAMTERTAYKLIPKREMLEMVGVKSYTTVWQWQREGTFPLGLAVGARTMWRSDEIEQWMAAQHRREVKAADDKPQPEQERLCREAYQTQKKSALKRGISWQFSYEEWVHWWQSQLGPNWMELRGRLWCQYVMARPGDIGPYSPDNVKCVQPGTNIREANSARAQNRLANAQLILDAEKH
jgi:predicted DNA-binding transcriptional regulator AlpA